jgi:hypothetical protein
MLQLGIDPNTGGARQGGGFGEGGDRLHTVKNNILRPQVRQPLLASQGFKLCEKKIFCEPPGEAEAVDDFARPPVRELRAVGHIRALPDLAIMPTDQDPILGHDKVRLDKVGFLIDPEPIGRKRMLRPIC